MGDKAVVYIGDFDLRNENVQAHLVKNNGKILNQLGYSVYFVGTNRNCFSFDDVKQLQPLDISIGDYLELPHTLTPRGILQLGAVENTIISYLKKIKTNKEIEYIITYQAPTYARVLKTIALWAKSEKIAYIVNCADLPVFDSQPFIKRMVMNLNWKNLHAINKKYADGVISVSNYIAEFYKKEGRPSVIIPPLFDEPDLLGLTPGENDVAVFLYAGTPFISSTHEINTKGMKDRLDKVIDIMLEVEKRGSSFRFDIVGITKEEYCTCVPRHAKDLSKSNNIFFYGKQSHEYTLRKLISADFMINFRDKNLMTEAGMSTKVVESVSVGTPVVMNEIGDTFMYLTEGISGIKLVGDIQADVNTIAALCLSSKEQRAKNKQTAKASKTFSIETYLPVMSKFLCSVAKSIQ